jgi:hypothetical protein
MQINGNMQIKFVWLVKDKTQAHACCFLSGSGHLFGTKLPNKQQNPHPDLSYNMVTVLFSAFVKFLCLFSLKMRQPCY